MKDLPTEILLLILGFVNSSKSLYHLACTSSRFRHLVKNLKTKHDLGEYSTSNDIYSLLLYDDYSDFKDANGQSLLHIASYHGYKNQVRYLLAKQPGLINRIDNFQNTALFLAVIRDNKEVSDLLLSREDCYVQEECLDFAVQNMNRPLIKRFLARGIITTQCLFIAIEIEDIESIKLILPTFKDLTIRIRNGWTLLHCAVYTGNISICKLLLDAGCFINAIDDYGISSLHVSVHSNGGLEMVTFLVNNGADLNMKSLSGISPLIRAVMCRNFAVCRFLLKSGCDASIKTVGGASALSIATLKGYYHIQQLLNQNILVQAYLLVLKV